MVFAVGLLSQTKFYILAGKEILFCEKYMNTEPAASDNINRMRLGVTEEKKKLLSYGLRDMERNSVFAWQVYMDIVRC